MSGVFFCFCGHFFVLCLCGFGVLCFVFLVFGGGLLVCVLGGGILVGIASGAFFGVISVCVLCLW